MRQPSFCGVNRTFHFAARFCVDFLSLLTDSTTSNIRLPMTGWWLQTPQTFFRFTYRNGMMITIHNWHTQNIRGCAMIIIHGICVCIYIYIYMHIYIAWIQADWMKSKYNINKRSQIIRLGLSGGLGWWFEGSGILWFLLCTFFFHLRFCHKSLPPLPEAVAGRSREATSSL